ncbi:MAG TPA: response regulator, partial [Myxococcota bacterium]
TVDGTALAIRGVRFLVVGDDVLAAQVRSALAPWSPFIERADAHDAKARWQAQEGTAPFHVLIVAGDALDAVSGVAEGRLIAVVSTAALGVYGNAIERVGATPILLPITTGNLFGAVERVLRRLHNLDHGSRDVELHGAVVHAADDDPDARLLIDLFLRDTGVQLHLHSTTQGLINAVAADDSTTLVLCDVEMPDGGARVARAAMPVREGVTFVPVTAHGDAVIDDLHAEGFVEVARKPLTRRGLIDVIARRGVPRGARRASSMSSMSSSAAANAGPLVVGAAVPAPTGSEPTIVLSASMQKQQPGIESSSSASAASSSSSAAASSSAGGALDVDAIQLEARMALARRDYRALTLLGRRLQPPFKEKLEAAARAKNDAGVRDVLRELEQGPPPADDVDDAIRALLPDYLERRRSDAAEVADALANGRYDHVAFVGHRLAGTARAFGMEALSDVGSGLERAGAHRADDDIRALLQRMHQLLAEASR